MIGSDKYNLNQPKIEFPVRKLCQVHLTMYFMANSFAPLNKAVKNLYAHNIKYTCKSVNIWCNMSHNRQHQGSSYQLKEIWLLGWHHRPHAKAITRGSLMKTATLALVTTWYTMWNLFNLFTLVNNSNGKCNVSLEVTLSYTLLIVSP